MNCKVCHPECKGNLKVSRNDAIEALLDEHYQKGMDAYCPDCGGDGLKGPKYDEPCPRCGGTGHVAEDETTEKSPVVPTRKGMARRLTRTKS